MNAEESTEYAACLRDYCREHNSSAVVTIEGGIYEAIFDYFDDVALFCWSNQLYYGSPDGNSLIGIIYLCFKRFGDTFQSSNRMKGHFYLLFICCSIRWLRGRSLMKNVA